MKTEGVCLFGLTPGAPRFSLRLVFRLLCRCLSLSGWFWNGGGILSSGILWFDFRNVRGVCDWICYLEWW